MIDSPDALGAFIKASVWHGSLDDAEAILAAHPEIATSDIYAAAILGDETTVRRFLELDQRNATAKGGPLGWDALTHLCFSKYLRLDRSRSDGFIRAATTLLDGGASARTGFWNANHQPTLEWESALYGAAGVAHHASMTRLLLERGAEPDDEEVVYHTPETYDNDALKLLVETGRLRDESLAMIFTRKTDWHDYDGIKWLLEYGVDPNLRNRVGKTAIHNAALSDNSIGIFQVLLDHRANPTLVVSHPEHRDQEFSGRSAVAIAARRGRGDVLQLFERRGIPIELRGLEGLLAACARNDPARVRGIVDRDPHLVGELLAEGGKRLAQFAGNGNTEGVRHLLDLGVDVKTLYKEGEPYFNVAKESMALHVAAWRARHATVKLLIARGAPVNVPDGKGQTPLALAVRACVDSYWAWRRSPESVEALLRAGAAAEGIKLPSGYADVDELLRSYGAGA